MHNLFRCSCGDRWVCGTGEYEYDSILQEAMHDHRKMGHDVLKPLKIPSNNLEDAKMTVHDVTVDDDEDENDDAYTTHVVEGTVA
jgi:hypothetical protein